MIERPSPSALARDLEALGLKPSARQIEELFAFAELLARWNRRFNLLSRRDVDRLWPRHILDSLSVAPLVRGRRLLDLGSGGGLPGLPLAIVLPDRELVLLDRSQRKCRFMELAAAELGLVNVSVRALAAQALDARFDTVVSRAVLAPSALLELARPLLAPGGTLLAMASTKAGTGALPDGWSRRELTIPGLDQSHEVAIISVPGENG